MAFLWLLDKKFNKIKEISGGLTTNGLFHLWGEHLIQCTGGTLRVRLLRMNWISGGFNSPKTMDSGPNNPHGCLYDGYSFWVADQNVLEQKADIVDWFSVKEHVPSPSYNLRGLTRVGRGKFACSDITNDDVRVFDKVDEIVEPVARFAFSNNARGVHFDGYNYFITDGPDDNIHQVDGKTGSILRSAGSSFFPSGPFGLTGVGPYLIVGG